MGYPGASIYLFTDRAIASVPYAETEHYVITRSFLNNPERMLRELLSDPSDEDPEGGSA
jgi:predicted ATPase